MNLRLKPLPQLNREAFEILVREMGLPETLRFFGQFSTGAGDYTQERKDLFKDLSLDEYRQDLARLNPPPGEQDPPP